MNRFYQSISFFFIFFLFVILTNGNSIGMESRIVGGDEADEGAYPYQVSLRTNGRPFCGGSIITTLHVVTAAHCVPSINITLLTVITGTNSLIGGGEAHGVVEITSHENYIGSSDYWKYDIAILTLAEELTVTPLQYPIPVATEDPPYGVETIVSGWGRSFFESYAIPARLQYVNPATMSVEDCRQVLREEVDEVHLCALRDVGKSVCSGDSGGPMVYDGKLIGIVSWGRTPCGTGIPDAYARVSKMIDFIERVTGMTLSK